MREEVRYRDTETKIRNIKSAEDIDRHVYIQAEASWEYGNPEPKPAESAPKYRPYSEART